MLITDKEPCKFVVNKRQNTNYSFLPVTIYIYSKVSCIRKKQSQIICLQGNNKSMLKSTCDVNLLSKLSINFKEWRVMNNVDRGGARV